jgi:hypothetical protein
MIGVEEERGAIFRDWKRIPASRRAGRDAGHWVARVSSLPYEIYRRGHQLPDRQTFTGILS